MSLGRIIFSVVVPLTCAAAGLPPALFFSDLESGPSRGGEHNQGAYVTLYGKNFGTARDNSWVTVGGIRAENYPVWTDHKITFQLGNSALSGDIVVETSRGSSRGIPFTVRPGNIHFVSTEGSDANDGSFERPWKSVPKAAQSMKPGDITYLRDGTSQPMDDGSQWRTSLLLRRSGEPGKPLALVAYPGATAIIGDANGPDHGIRTPNAARAVSHWVLAGLTLRGKVSALSVNGPSEGWRIAANDISCPGGNGYTGCVAFSQAVEVKFLGNKVHDCGRPGRSKKYHAVYFGTDARHIDVGWNEIVNNDTCRALQFHSSPLCVPACGATDRTGLLQYDLSVHDNLIEGAGCDGINFATVNPSEGKVEAFNNVIYSVGRGPDGPDGTANYSCIHVAGITNNGLPGAGTVEVFNNTVYDCGSRKVVGSSGAFTNAGGSPDLILRLRNNIAYQTPGEVYVDGRLSLIRGEKNLWFGVRSPPVPTLVSNIDAYPVFVDLEKRDFRLKAGSPAIGAGVNTGISTDKDGVPRRQGGNYDIGAFEFAADSLLSQRPSLPRRRPPLRELPRRF